MSTRTFARFIPAVSIAVLALLVVGGAGRTVATSGPTASTDTVPSALVQAQAGIADGQVSASTFTGPADAATTTADAVNVQLVSHIGGAMYAVFVQGHYAYVGEGPRLTILDVSDPASPTVVGKTSLLPDIVQGIYVSDGYAYVADGVSGLRVVDVTNPAAPAEVAFYNTWGNAYGVTVAGDPSTGSGPVYAYVADGSEGLWIVNVTDPVTPVAVGRLNTPGNAYGVAVAWPYVYVADGTRGLRVVDVSNLIIPEEVGFYDTPGDAFGVAVVGDYAYVADKYRGLRVIDVSDPTDPVEVGFYDTPGYAYAVAVAGPYAYVADGSKGLRVIDVSDPTAPVEVGYYDTPGDARDVAVAGDPSTGSGPVYAYVADRSSGLRVVDVSNPTMPAEVGFYDTPGYAYAVAVAEDYAYIADYYAGLRVVDVSDPTHPAEAGYYNTPGRAYGVAAVEGYAYVADYDRGLRIIDVSDPTAPAEVGFYDTPSSARDVAVAGNYAYVADGSSGLRVIDVSDPTNPAEAGFHDTPGYAYGVAVAGSYAYVADGSSGLRVIDVSDPTAPVEAGYYDTPGYAYGVAVAGSYAYVADGSSGLRVIDVSDPTIPAEAGFYDTPGDARGVAVVGGYAYVANGSKGPRVIDVSDPAAPAEVGFYDTPGTAYGAAVVGTYAYVADGSSGLRVVDVSDPMGPAVGFYTTPGWAHGVAVAGDPSTGSGPVYTYVAAGSEGLWVVDVADPADPVAVGRFSTPGAAYGVAMAEDYAYVADGSSGLRVIDISMPANPAEVSHIDTPGTAYGVAVAGDYACVADGSRGLRMVYIADPTAPRELGFYNTPGEARGVAVAWPYCYIADESGGLRVVDVTYPTIPEEVGFCGTPGYAYAVAVEGAYAYVAAGSSGLQVVDVSDPTDPTKVGYYNTPGSARDVAVVRDYAYVADGDSGLRVIDVSDPTHPAEVGFYDTPGDAQGVAVAAGYIYAADAGGGLFILYTGGGPLADVTISGPTTGIVDTPYTFIATASPPTATQPITYTWQATDQSSLTHVGGRSDAVVYTWDTPGTQAITVTADNGLSTVSDTHTIAISPLSEVPVERVTISGPATGTGGTLYTFTATVSPITATQPITYAWQATGQSPRTHVGGRSDTVSFTWDTAGTKMITVTASNAWDSAMANHAIAISEPGHDAYEPDDACAQASTLATNGTAQHHTFHQHADEDWARFTVTSGITYVLQAISTSPGADLVLELYDACGGNLEGFDDDGLGADARLIFTAPSDGTYYVRALNHDPAAYGPGVTYKLSAWAQSQAGVAIIVAGRKYSPERLQSNINHVANQAFWVFRNGGIPPEDIYYLHHDATQDADGDGFPDVDGTATASTLEYALTTWAASRAGPGTPLYLYLVDHGTTDLFMIDGRDDAVTPTQLDGWLTTLESATGCPVNVIIESCRSGSFIAAPQEISKQGRVIVTSAAAHQTAHAYRDGKGAYFSNHFLSLLSDNADLWTCYTRTHSFLEGARLGQTPWLDDNGDAVSDARDGAIARQRGLISPTLGAIPWIASVSPPVQIDGYTTAITATVYEDEPSPLVWAEIIAPSYRAPDPEDEMAYVDVPKILLEDGDGDGTYTGNYGGFTEIGEYRVVVYARDGDGNQGLPRTTTVRTGWRLFLPLVLSEAE